MSCKRARAARVVFVALLGVAGLKPWTTGSCAAGSVSAGTVSAGSSIGYAQSAGVRIRAARVLDGAGHSFVNPTVVVKGSTIAAIETSPRGPVDFDFPASTLLPGLIDVHAHIAWHFGADGRYEPRSASAAQEVLYAAENAYVTLMAG